MAAIEERTEFSERLQHALRNADYSTDSPTQLAREFNARFSGSPVTVHGARKWLVGEAIPTQEKLRVLAQWLGVTAEWLRYGTGKGSEPANDSTAFDTESVRLVNDLKRLDAKGQKLARDFIRLLVRQAA